MPSTRETILAALFIALEGVGGATVKRNYSLPHKIPSGGLVILRDGSPGEPETSLSPLTYHYEHAAIVEVMVEGFATQDRVFDTLCREVGYRIAADRSLGGLCDWVETTAPEPTDIITEGGEPIKGASLTVTLHYATQTPL